MLGPTVNVALLDLIRDILWTLAINLATNTESGAEDFKHGTLQLLGQGLVGASHCSGNINDLVQRDGLRVLDVLLLLSVAWWLLESSNDEGRGRWDDRDSSLTILDRELDGDSQTLPVSSGFGDILTDLLRRQTKRTNFRSEGSGGTNFTTSGSQMAAKVSPSKVIS